MVASTGVVLYGLNAALNYIVQMHPYKLTMSCHMHAARSVFAINDILYMYKYKGRRKHL